MAPHRQRWNELRYSPINTDKRAYLGSTKIPPTQELFDYLERKLGLIFRDELTENSYLLGSVLLEGSGHDSIALLATRHWDRSPGVDILIAWDHTEPSMDMIQKYLDDVEFILALAP